MKSPEAIICTSPEKLEFAKNLAKKHKLPLLDEIQGQLFFGISLKVGNQIQIHDPEIGNPLEADFCSPAFIKRLGAGRKQPLGRACGLNKNQDLNILDCTAGMGQDMLALAAMGAKMTAVERNEFVYVLLEDAYFRAAEHPTLQKVLENCPLPIKGNAIDLIKQSDAGRWDVIYLDPMFSGYKRKALPKKSMQLFSEVCGTDEDAGDLLTTALEKSGKRVVVKRGNQAPLLNGFKPDHQIKSQRVRFDVYISAN